MDVSENSGVFPPNPPWINRVFHDFHHPLWGKTPYFRKHPYEVTCCMTWRKKSPGHDYALSMAVGMPGLRGEVWGWISGWFFCLHMDDWGAWQLKYFCYFHPENLGKILQFDEHIFQRGWFNHQLDEFGWFFFDNFGGSGLGRWIFEGSRKDLIKLLLISLSLKWKRKPHKQVLCVWVWCLYWCPAILQWGCLTPGGFFINIYWCSKKHHVQAHTVEMIFSQKIEVSQPPPQKKNLHFWELTYPIPRHFWRWFSFSPNWIC